MRRLFTGLFLGVVMLTSQAFAAAEVGKPAPAFTATDSNGKTHSLSDFAGKTVVLEWTNHDCPFVKKFYKAGKMQELQRAATADGVVWLSVISSAPGKEGHVTGAAANKLTTDRNAAPTAVLLDEKGTVGNLYGAKTTPHFFIVNSAGVVAYAGAIDSIKSTDSADIASATNYVAQALGELKAGKAVSIPSTQAYGCSVKY